MPASSAAMLRTAVILIGSLRTTLAADNGLALLPPMGWRSWNTYYASIDATKISAQIDALAAMRDKATGAPSATGTVSLLSLGYASIGIDEGWEGCGLGVNGTVHYVNGTPAVNPQRFPDMPGLVAYGHSVGVKMGFYLNGCGCNEKVERRINYEGDVRATVAWGFDGVKIDSCGAQKNMTLYGALINASGKALVVENCHQGRNITDGGDPDQMGPGWCPYNLFRTSGDIVNLWDRVMSNLMTVAPFLAVGKGRSTPLSRPGCWAYPDMLEVGRMPEHNAAESRSHFGAWAVVSAPLVLGFDLSNASRLAKAWPTISNAEVIAVSQSWQKGAPHPTGALLQSWQARNVPTMTVRGSCAADTGGKGGAYTGWRWDEDEGRLSIRLPSRGPDEAAEQVCLDAAGQLPQGHDGGNALHMKPCSEGNATSQQWRLAGGQLRSVGSPSLCLSVFRHWLWNYVPVPQLQRCASEAEAEAVPAAQLWTLEANATLRNGG